MKLLVDMNLSPRWVEFLAEAGFDAVHRSQVGPGDARDYDLMRWATDHDRVVLTSDLDFGAILAATRERKPSVLLLGSDLLTPERVGAEVLAALQRERQELAEGALISIDAARARLRVLPLRE